MPLSKELETRTNELFIERQRRLRIQTNNVFCGLLLTEWAFAIFCALVISPLSWEGSVSYTHIHVWAALILGGVICLPAIAFGLLWPTLARTPHVIAVAQMLMSALLIHLLGGRIEAHFHVFGSLAFLAFYRDPLVLLTATFVVGFDHFFRGVYWPQSAFGVVSASPWRWVEHTTWIVFEDVFLVWSCLRGRHELRTLSLRQAELEQVNARIELAVDERTRELKETQGQLLQAQKLEALGKLTGGIAHDFNNLLGGILGYANLIKEDYPVSPEVRGYLDVIERSAERGAELVKKLLAFARKGNLQQVPVDFRQLLRETESLLHPMLRQKVTITVSTSSDLWQVKGDPNQFMQVLMNLGVNSADAMENGGALTLSAENVVLESEKALTSGTVKPGNYVRVMARDTGAGIPSAVLERIFEPFFTTKEVGKGTGLGLSVVYGIVESHHGGIQVTSKEGQGTTFELYFPADQSEKLAAESTKSLPVLPKVRLQGRQILVVDDEELLRRIASEVLERQGARVFSANNGEEALAIYQAHPEIDTVVLDVIMPRLDGLATYERLIQMNPGLKIVFASGYGENPRLVQLRSARQVQFVQKPFRVETLVSELCTPSVTSISSEKYTAQTL